MLALAPYEDFFSTEESENGFLEFKAKLETSPNFGKNLLWTGSTILDACEILFTYLTRLPETVIPLTMCERFREPLRQWPLSRRASLRAERARLQSQSWTFSDIDTEIALAGYGRLVIELPDLNRRLLFYLIDLFATLASKCERDLNTAINQKTYSVLAAKFQCGNLSHTNDQTPAFEQKLNEDVLIFLMLHANMIAQRYNEREYYLDS